MRHCQRLHSKAVGALSLGVFKVEWGPGEPDLVSDSPAHGMVIELDGI